MARIYVSSTYGDLKDFREKAYRVLRQLGHDAVAMEDYVATDQRPLARCLADVAAGDLYMGIFAHRYGYVPVEDNPDHRSITELEYRHAAALGIPCLLFLLDVDVPWPPRSIDGFTGEGDRGTRIESLRKELGRERLVSFFSSADQLAQQIAVAVTTHYRYDLIDGLPLVAAVRAWTIPAPVSSFTGRNNELTRLSTQLMDEGAATLVPTAALYGMGGVGKTQLALAYAQHHRKDYQLGWWIPAETKLGILSALADLGQVLGLRSDQTPTELAAQVRDALANRSGWLLIFDNAPDSASVAEYLPVAGGGHVLVTSRDPAWQGIAEPVPLDLLTSDEAVQLLTRRSGDGDIQAAARLAEAVDRLPLALEQASAYVAQQHMTLAEYLELFDERRVELLARGQPLAYTGTVDTVFALTIQHLREQNAAAVQLLELCALLAPDELPIDLLLSQPDQLPEPLATAARDPLHRRETVAALFAAGVLTKDMGGTARMHRLIQAVTQHHLPDLEWKQHITEVIELMAALFPYEGDQPDRWPQCAQLLLHAQTLINHALAAQLGITELADLLTCVGIYVRHRNLDHRLAHQMHEQALTIYQQLHNSDSNYVANGLCHVAFDLRLLNEPKLARELDEQALAIFQRLYEGDNVYVAVCIANLALDLGQVGEVERALELEEQALAMFQRLFEGDNVYVAGTTAHIAADLREAGEDERARELEEQALAMRRRLYEGDHPDTARSMNNLAADLRRAGEDERARELDEQALAMLQRLYEGDHPDTAKSMSNLAIDLQRAREDERARELDEQAEAMRQRLAEG